MNRWWTLEALVEQWDKNSLKGQEFDQMATTTQSAQGNVECAVIVLTIVFPLSEEKPQTSKVERNEIMMLI